MNSVIFHVLSAVQNKSSVIKKQLKTTPALESGRKITGRINKRSINPVLYMIRLIKAVTRFRLVRYI